MKNDFKLHVLQQLHAFDLSTGLTRKFPALFKISRALQNFPRFAGPVPSIISSSYHASLLLSGTQPLTGLVRKPEKI
jgi:hypothetical protein